jgi:predicted metal-binding protein
VDTSEQDFGAGRTRVYVCVTCRTAPDEQPRAGARLHDALRHAIGDDPKLELIPVECLSVCKRPCTAALSAPGKWTYVYADLPADTAADVLLAGAALYADAPDGIIPWKQRPEALKRGVVARIPPLPRPSNPPSQP